MNGATRDMPVHSRLPVATPSKHKLPTDKETMINLTVLNEQNAPEESRGVLAQVRQKFGFVPNMLGTMAHAPTLLKTYLTVSSIFEQGTLNPVEQQVVLLSVSAQNGCGYCVAAHTVIAGMVQAPQDVVDAIRAGSPIADPKLEALRRFTADVVEKRGFPGEDSVNGFLAAGYSKEQVLEVLVGVGMKTISNYTNHLAETPLDAAFARAEWQPTEAAVR